MVMGCREIVRDICTQKEMQLTRPFLQIPSLLQYTFKEKVKLWLQLGNRFTSKSSKCLKQLLYFLYLLKNCNLHFLHRFRVSLLLAAMSRKLKSSNPI